MKRGYFMTADDARFLMEHFQTDYVNQHYHHILEKIEKKYTKRRHMEDQSILNVF